ncbi:hypothetical protein ACFLT8_07435, partial [Chloroflexota bacterium]
CIRYSRRRSYNVSIPLIVPVSCPVADRPEGASKLEGILKNKAMPDSMAFLIYQQSLVEESFHCNFELNRAFQGMLEAAGVRMTGLGENGEVRIIELSAHHFFLATGYLPRRTSVEGRPHPLVTAYLEGALNFSNASWSK